MEMTNSLLPLYTMRPQPINMVVIIFVVHRGTKMKHIFHHVKNSVSLIELSDWISYFCKKWTRNWQAMFIIDIMI